MVLAAWASFAIFSPLHRHDLESPTKCTLNNLDAQQAETPLVIDTLPSVTFRERLDSPAAPRFTPAPLYSKKPARAPPAFS